MLSLKPAPTFKKEVLIHVPGGEPMAVPFEFNHMGRARLNAFLYGPDAAERSDVDTVLAISPGWINQVEPYNRDNLQQLFDSYPGASRSIVHTFVQELTQAKLGA